MSVPSCRYKISTAILINSSSVYRWTGEMTVNLVGNEADNPEKKQKPPKKQILEVSQTFQSADTIEKPIFLVTIPPAMYLKHIYS